MLFEKEDRMKKNSGTKIPKKKTITKPKFWQEFLKCLAVCLAISMFASYRYLINKKSEAEDEIYGLYGEYIEGVDSLAEDLYRADEETYDEQYYRTMWGLYLFSNTTNEYGAVYLRGEKIMETKTGVISFVSLSEKDGKLKDLYFLEDSSYLDPISSYEDGKYDIAKNVNEDRKLIGEQEMAQIGGMIGYYPTFYGYEYESIYVNEQTHQFLPGKVKVNKWEFSRTDSDYKYEVTIDCTPSDTKGYTCYEGAPRMAFFGYVDPAKSEAAANLWYMDGSRFGEIEGFDPANNKAWLIHATSPCPEDMSMSELIPLTMRVTLVGAGIAAILVSLIIAALRYWRKKSVYEIFDYRKKTTEAMAHDLKTPLATISAYAESLEEKPDQASEYSAKIRENVDEMNQMLERILHFSRSEGGQTSIAKSTVDPEVLVRETVEKYRGLFEKNQVTTSIVGGVAEAAGDGAAIGKAAASGSGESSGDGAGKRPVVITTDEALFRQAIENLISNCAKYAEPGSEVEIRISGKEISFKNRTSLETENVDELKKPFVKGDAARGENGTGLGLSIADNNLSILGYKLVLALADGYFTATVVLE